MAENPTNNHPKSPPFSVKKETYLNGKLFTYDESYDVVEYADTSRYVEIHKPGCTVWQKENAIRLNEEPRYLSSGLVIGPLGDAEGVAERQVKKGNYPGWRKAPCCFDPDWKGVRPTKEEVFELIRLRVTKMRRIHTAFNWNKPSLGPPGKPEYYIVLHPDPSRYVEIHKADCVTWRKEMESRKPGRDIGSWVTTDDTLEWAEKLAEMNARDGTCPGWRRAECCFK